MNSDPLIRTKLRPPLIRAGLVPRARLQEQLSLGLRGPLTLVTAPAGFGKTTLVASCVGATGLPVAWLSLEKDDDHIERFLRYLVAAIQTAVPGIGDQAINLLGGAPQAPSEAALTSLINDLDSYAAELVLVLEDYQFISSSAIHGAIAFLLEHLPNAIHLVIASRSDPALPLARLRARGQVAELRAGDLRFTPAEAAQFLNESMGLQLDAGAITLLEERTEGWIAGLQMAALSMRGRADVAGFIREFAGTNRFIMDFMLEEVLSREPDKVQSFLLDTAFLTRLTGPLCDDVTGVSGGQEMLEQLEKRSIFVVPLDDERRWYRYHHLFADLLRARLLQSDAGRAAQVLARASAWCERDGQVAEAISYALNAPDYRRAGLLIGRYWHITANRGEIETVWNWLEALPKDLVKNHTPLGLAYCWVLWLKGLTGAIEPHLVEAENALRTPAAGETIAWDDSAYAAMPAHLAVLRSIVARNANDLDTAINLAEGVLRLAPGGMPMESFGMLRTIAAVALASAYDGAGCLEKAVDAYREAIHWCRLGKNGAGLSGMTNWLAATLTVLGHLHAAETACREALSFFEDNGMARLPSTGLVHIRLSDILLERNDLAAANEHLALGSELGKWSGRFDAVRNSAPVLVRLKLAQGDPAAALSAVLEAEAAESEASAFLWRAELLSLKARILACQGDTDSAARLLQQAGLLLGSNKGQVTESVASVAARLQCAGGRPAEVIAALTRDLTLATNTGRQGVALERLILRSLARQQAGDTRSALADLERALNVAEPEGYVRIFIDEGQPMQTLLAQWLAQAGAHPLRNYAFRLLGQFADTAAASPPAPVTTSPNDQLLEPLSQRELEVLHLMALGKPNPRIAAQLYVAPGTIKAHAAAIYRKLDVANRTEAVTRARKLGILP